MRVRRMRTGLETAEAECLADSLTEVKAQQEEGGRELAGCCTVGCGNVELQR